MHSCYLRGFKEGTDNAAGMEIESRCQTSLAWTGLELAGGSAFEVQLVSLYLTLSSSKGDWRILASSCFLMRHFLLPGSISERKNLIG